MFYFQYVNRTRLNTNFGHLIHPKFWSSPPSDDEGLEQRIEEQIRESKSLIIPKDFDANLSSNTDLHLECLKIGFVPNLPTRYNDTCRTDRDTSFEDVIKGRNPSVSSKYIYIF